MNKNMKDVISKLVHKNKGLQVQSFISFPSVWKKLSITNHLKEIDEYEKEYGKINHREICKDEIVIDIDTHSTADAVEHASLVLERIRKNKFVNKFDMWESGGDGLHFHIFFDDLSDKYPEKSVRQIVKNVIIKSIIGKRLMKHKSSHICLWPKTLIQLEYAKHRKGGIKRLKYHNYSGENNLNHFIKEINTELKIIDERVIRRKNLPRPTNLNCISFLLGRTVNGFTLNKIQDGMYRSAFLLIAYYKRMNKSEEEIIEIMTAWYKNLPEEWRKTNKSFNLYMLSRMVGPNNGSVGCPYAIELFGELECTGVCKGCPYNYV